MTVTAAHGFRAAGVAAGLKAAAARRRAGRQRRPARAAAGVFTGNRVKAAPVVWSQQAVRDGGSTRSSSTPAAPTPAPAPPASRTPTRPPSGSPWRSGLGRRRRGLLDRADRRAAAHRPAAGRGRRRRGRCSPWRRRRRGAGHHDHRLGAEAGRRGRRRLPASAGWPRAPACSRPASRRCSSSSPLTPSWTPDRLDAVLRAATRRPSTGSTPTAACPPTTPSCCSPAARPASRRGDELLGRRRRRLRRPGAAARRRRRGLDEGHRGEVARAATGRRRRRSAGRRPQQPAQVRDQRRGPELGPGARAVGTTDAAFEPDQLAVAINGVWVCRDGAAAEDRGWSTCPAARSTSPSTSAPATTRPRSGPTTSPPTTSTRTRRTRHEQPPAPPPWRRPPSWSRRCPGWSASTAAPSS